MYASLFKDAYNASGKSVGSDTNNVAFRFFADIILDYKLM